MTYSLSTEELQALLHVDVIYTTYRSISEPDTLSIQINPDSF